MFKCSDKLDALVNYLMQAWLIRSRCFISSMRCWMGLKHVGTKARVAWTLNQRNHANVGINASTSNQLRVSVIGCWLAPAGQKALLQPLLRGSAGQMCEEERRWCSWLITHQRDGSAWLMALCSFYTKDQQVLLMREHNSGFLIPNVSNMVGWDSLVAVVRTKRPKFISTALFKILILLCCVWILQVSNQVPGVEASKTRWKN